METVLIIGGGIAGFSLAREIRKLNPNQQITLLSRDTQLFDRDEFPRLLACPLYTSDAADDMECVVLCGSRIIRKKNKQ